MDVLQKFGARVRARRIQLGLSQEQVAARANLHRTYYGAVERGEKNISLRNIEKIADALRVEVRDLF